MRILVLGLYYDNNMGDAVLCDCTAARLQQWFPDAQIDIRDYVNRDAFPERVFTPLETLEKGKFRMMLRELATRYTPVDKQLKHEMWMLTEWSGLQHVDEVCAEDYDFVVFGGGQVFMDYLSAFADAFVERFSRKGTPMFFNACGTGPAFSPGLRKKLSAALMDPMVRLVSCRDGAELVNRRYMGKGRQAVDTFDSALHSSEAYGVRRKPDADTVGLGMMYTSSVPHRKAAEFWIRLIRELEARNIPWKIFVNGGEHDITFARYVHSQLPELNRPFEDCFAPPPNSPKELVETIAGFRSLISFRLHSHIIAASLDIPTVAMVWDGKLNAFFEKLGHGERCCTVKAAPEEILAKLERAEQEGYDRQLLAQQREYADALLRDAIMREFEQEKREQYEQNR